jgi:osmotically-inducible protein OsmY
MAGDLEELLAHDVRRVDEVVAVAQDQRALVVLDLAANDRAARMPKDEPRPHALVGAEEVQLAAEGAVIPFLRLLQPVDVGLEVILAEPRRAVDALQHLAVLVAAPICARGVQQLEVLDARRVGNVRPAAEVEEGPVGVDGDHLIVSQFGEPLQLERIVAELLLRLRAAHLLAHEGVLLLRRFLHLRLEVGEILGGEGLRHLEIVVEAVLDARAEADLRVGAEATHRGGEQVRGRVAEHIERRRILLREHAKGAARSQRGAEVLHRAVQLHGDGRAQQAGADARDHIARQRAVRDATDGAVGERERKLGVRRVDHHGRMGLGATRSAHRDKLSLWHSPRHRARMSRHRKSEDRSLAPVLAAAAAGALAGIAAGVILAQRLGGLAGIRARFKARFGAGARASGKAQAFDLDALREFADEAFADDESLDEYDDDELEPDADEEAGEHTLEHRVLDAFVADPLFRERAVDIGAVDESVVELSGWVNTAEERERAGTLARGVPGVRTVVNELLVGDPDALSAEDLARRT